MRLQYWGTAAAEGIPGMYCNCLVCRQAWQNGGKDIRARASALLGDKIMIDYSPDTNWNRLRFGYDMTQLRAICITHSHIDHLAAAELVLQSPNPYRRMQREDIHPIDIYCSQDSKDRILENIRFDGTEPIFRYHIWKVWQTEEVEGTRFTPLPAVHGEGNPCYIFLIEQDGRRLLYGNDTAFPTDAVFTFLRGKRLDVVSMDCTNGSRPTGATHMGLRENGELFARLQAEGCITPETRGIVTHFSHSANATHAALEAAAAPYGFVVAYDGLTIDI